jgi:hypothetical protein
VWFRYANLKDPIDLAKNNILLYYLTWFTSMSGRRDFVVLVHETANSLRQPRAVWVLPPEYNLRMFRIPPVGYDRDFPDSGGLQFVDMVDMYNGPFDRYDWKLLGKRELYIPYNSFRLSDGHLIYPQLLQPHHIDQNHTRYELHRVWVVEASERNGHTHAFGKRRFYVDEDSWNVVLVENEDHQGRLWRFQEGHLLPNYVQQAANCAPTITYDLKNGQYFINRLLAEDPPPHYDLDHLTESEFQPAAVQARYSH